MVAAFPPDQNEQQLSRHAVSAGLRTTNQTTYKACARKGFSAMVVVPSQASAPGTSEVVCPEQSRHNTACKVSIALWGCLKLRQAGVSRRPAVGIKDQGATSEVEAA